MKRGKLAMRRILVVSPHPDDETLGCGGVILRHIKEGANVSWMIITEMSKEYGFAEIQIGNRAKEISQVEDMYCFDKVYKLGLPTMQLDTIPIGKIIDAIRNVIEKESPEIIYVPFPGDAHSDHRLVYDAISTVFKWFRYPSVKSILCYETISETDFGINPTSFPFQPNFYVNIEKEIEKKIEIMKIYTSEMGDFPFPRSEEAIQSLAKFRGAACGFKAAEAFMKIKEVWE